eukprot:178318-Rhodomonas_salina.5
MKEGGKKERERKATVSSWMEISKRSNQAQPKSSSPFFTCARAYTAAQHTRMHTHMHTSVHAYAHTHAHTHTYAHTCTHTHGWAGEEGGEGGDLGLVDLTVERRLERVEGADPWATHTDTHSQRPRQRQRQMDSAFTDHEKPTVHNVIHRWRKDPMSVSISHGCNGQRTVNAQGDDGFCVSV